MIEFLTKLSWGLLLLLHIPPAAVLLQPALLGRLYGIEASGDLSVLMLHRGALFLGVLIVCAYAAIDPSARKAASIVVAISVISFLVVYLGAGMPEGSLRNIAFGDTIALLPLCWVSWFAWRV